ncbi:MAG: FkbM family methyltransferase [Oscillospiraceae bacterium]|nr:FkbM family methyltransferase [Oscillospiraceae bacterium]
MLDFITERQSCWEKLAAEKRPIFLYGMGNGADKILSVMEAFGAAPAGFFASDGFVRGHSFHGHKVHTLSEIEAKMGSLADDFVIVLAFGAGYRSLYDKIMEISERHTLIAPDVPVVGGGIFTYEYALENAEKIENVYNLLADDISREVYKNILDFKISGKPEYLHKITTDKKEIWDNVLYPDGDNESGGIYIDMGAYNGDTVKEFCGFTNGDYKQIFALEPDPKNYRKLEENTADLPSVHLFNAAAWNEDGLVNFAGRSGRNASVDMSSSAASKVKPVPALRGDSLCEKADYIKMDVEGAEKQAIEGAAELIKKGCRLNIACYHRTEDIFAIPLQIHALNPNLRLYMRHHLYIPAWDTNLYAR